MCLCFLCFADVMYENSCLKWIAWGFLQAGSFLWPDVASLMLMPCEVLKTIGYCLFIQNTQEMKRTLFNWTKQDKTCKTCQRSFNLLCVLDLFSERWQSTLFLIFFAVYLVSSYGQYSFKLPMHTLIQLSMACMLADDCLWFDGLASVCGSGLG